MHYKFTEKLAVLCTFRSSLDKCKQIKLISNETVSFSVYFRQNISLNRNILHWLFWLCSQKGVSDADSEYFVK